MQNEPIQPIETLYGGYRFRSRLEARWAVLLDALYEKWEYEKEGYDLKHGKYLPDFWLPRLKCWLEIKGEPPTKEEKQLCEDLAYATDAPVVIAFGPPTAPEYLNDESKPNGYTTAANLMIFLSDSTDSGGGTGWWDDIYMAYKKTTGDLIFATTKNWSSSTFMTPNWSEWDGLVLSRNAASAIPQSKLDCAKRARFEFGETGKFRPGGNS